MTCKDSIEEMTLEELREEFKFLKLAFDIERKRLEMIAKYVGADDYVDSISPILDALDMINVVRCEMKA